jgi:tetratricopeptide (TPR) repeat protein
MKLTGQIAMFGSYFSDAARAVEQLLDADLSLSLRAAFKANRALQAEAKRALLSGDSETAEEYFRQCKLVSHWYDPCDTRTPYLDFRFLYWEAEAGQLAAAMHRLKTTDWLRWMRLGATLHVARAYVLAGRRLEAIDILRDAGALGPDAYSCILGDGELGPAAKLRQLACSGHEKVAVEIATALTDISARTSALTVVAEGLAGIPGFFSDKLEG